MAPYIKLFSSIFKLRIGYPRALYSSMSDEVLNYSPAISTTSNIVQSGHIYFIATPIGNLLDITIRARETLKNVDIICAEDTRHTGQLLKLLDITPKRLLPHHEHNYIEQIPKIIDFCQQGQSIAVVSDAGTPGISDPGYQLAEACYIHNIPIHPIPGASAVVSALSVCGFPSSQFSFFGFIDVKGKNRTNKLTEISNYEYTGVFFEAPHRIITTLTQLCEIYKQDTRLCVCSREITKLHEEFLRGTVYECLMDLKSRIENKDNKANNQATRIKGEFTIVLAPKNYKSSSISSSTPSNIINNDNNNINYTTTTTTINDDDDDTMYDNQVNGDRHTDIDMKSPTYITSKLISLREDGIPRSEAVKILTEMTGVSKNIVYKLALEQKWPKPK